MPTSHPGEAVADIKAGASKRGDHASEQAIKALGLGLLIFALAWLSLAINGAEHIAPIWPANGVLLAALLRGERRQSLTILVIALFSVVLAGMSRGGGLGVTAVLGVSSTAEVGLSAWAIRTFVGGSADLSRPRNVALCGVVAILSAVICAGGVGMALGWLNRPHVLQSLALWTLAHALGQMILAPTILTLTPLAPHALRRFFGSKDLPSTAAALVGLVVVVVLVFAQPRYGVQFLVFAPLLVMVFQLEVLGAALGVLLTAIVSVAFTMTGHGPMLLVGGGPNEQVLLLQVFLLACVVVNFPVAAALADRRRAQDVVRMSEARLQFLSDHSQDVVVRLGLDRRILDISPSCRRYGYEPEELIGHFGGELNHLHVGVSVGAVIDELIADPRRKMSANVEWRVGAKSGEWVWSEGSVSVIRDARGEPVECVLVVRDISAHKAAAEALANSEARYRLLAENSQDLVLQFDARGAILYASASAALLGYQPDDLVGQNCFDFVHPDDVERARGRMAAVAYPVQNPPMNSDGEIRVRGADGVYRWFEGNPSVSRGADGRPNSFTDSLRDVSARRAFQGALAESEANYRLLADNATDVIVRCDAKGIMTYLSPSAERVSGYAIDELVGISASHMVHPDDVDDVASRFRTFLATAEPGDEYRYEYRLIRKDGATVWIEANPKLLIDPETGERIGVLDFIRDVSKRKAMEFALSHKRAEAEASEAARRAAEEATRDTMAELARVARLLSVGEFATSVAHELNQPIAAIVTNSDTSLRWLGKEPPNLEEARAAIGRTIRDANRAAAVISRTRAMLAKGPPTFTDLDLNDCVEEVLLFTETELRRNHVKVRRLLLASLPKVRGDRIQLQQVMLNLVRNGVEAMADNGGRARVLTLTTRAMDAGDVLVAVEDTGGGLDAETADRLFDSFFTTKVGGIGLGLPISRSIIETHGGQLWAAPGAKTGAVFQFTMLTADNQVS